MPHADPEARRAYARGYYRRRKAEHLATQQRHRRKKRNLWDTLKAGRPCTRCRQEFPPCVLDWHHRDPETKDPIVMNNKLRVSEARIRAEIEKCDLLCANCHRLLHCA